MKCVLKDHIGVTPRYREALLFCPLFKNETGSMSTVGILCVHHCLKTQQIIDGLNNLIMRGEVIREDLKHNSTCFYLLLPDGLKGLAKIISEKSGMTWEAISSECSRCSGTPVETNDTPKAEPTEITQVDRDNLRV